MHGLSINKHKDNTVMKKILLMAMALLCLNSCVIGAEETQDTGQYDSQLLQRGETAPDFTITNADHPEGISLSAFRGQYVVLEFWASWCPDCRRETPTMVDLYETYAPRGVQFVGVSFDTDSATWQNYVRQNGMDWIQYSELKKWKNGTTLDGPYKVNWIPTVYLIDPEGKIAAGSISTANIRAALEALQLPETSDSTATAAQKESEAEL